MSHYPGLEVGEQLPLNDKAVFCGSGKQTWSHTDTSWSPWVSDASGKTKSDLKAMGGHLTLVGHVHKKVRTEGTRSLASVLGGSSGEWQAGHHLATAISLQAPSFH